MLMPAYLPIFSITITFCMASSRVGQMHSACDTAGQGRPPHIPLYFQLSR
jgi:hypothetical protein